MYHGDESLRLNLNLTGACNLRCSYCYSGPGRPMTWKTAKRAADYFLAYAAREGFGGVLVTFEGGEPMAEYGLMRRVMAYALRTGKRLRLRVGGQFCTNVTLLSPARFRTLAALRLWPVLTLGGVGPDHDRYRRYAGGRGTFSDVDRIIKEMGALRPVPRDPYRRRPVEFRINFTRESLPRLARAVRYIYDSYELAGRGFVILMPAMTPGARWTAADLAELRRQFSELAGFVASRPRGGALIGMNECLGSTPLLGDDPPEDFLSGRARCDGGTRAFSLSQAGEIFPCYIQASRPGDNRPFLMGSVNRGAAAPAPRTPEAAAFIAEGNPGLCCRYWRRTARSGRSIYAAMAREFARAAAAVARARSGPSR